MPSPGMGLKRLTERVSAPLTGSKVDRDKGVIFGVKLCGLTSVNARDYPAEMFRRDFRKYEGVPIYADHSKERSITKKIGWIQSPRVDADGTPRGDAHFLKSHAMYGPVMEAAERNPDLFGFSHVAMCQTTYSAGRERVEGLQEVESVDLVGDPATTGGFFESIQGSGAVSYTIKQLAEWVTKHPQSTTKQITRAKRLAEMDGMADAPLGMAGDGGAPADGCEPDDAISAGFKAAIMSLVEKAMGEGGDPKDALKKIKKLLDSHADVKGGGDEPEEEEEDEPTPPASEGKNRRSKALQEAIAACDAAGFRPDGVDLDMVAGAPADRRVKLIERLKKASEGSGAETPRSAGRHQVAADEVRREAVAAKAGDPPTDAKGYAKWVSE